MMPGELFPPPPSLSPSPTPMRQKPPSVCGSNIPEVMGGKGFPLFPFPCSNDDSGADGSFPCFTFLFSKRLGLENQRLHSTFLFFFLSPLFLLPFAWPPVGAKRLLSPLLSSLCFSFCVRKKREDRELRVFSVLPLLPYSGSTLQPNVGISPPSLLPDRVSVLRGSQIFFHPRPSYSLRSVSAFLFSSFTLAEKRMTDAARPSLFPFFFFCRFSDEKQSLGPSALLL